MKQRNPIDLRQERGQDGEIERITVRFGPHYVAEIRDDGERVSFSLGRHSPRLRGGRLRGQRRTRAHNQRRASRPPGPGRRLSRARGRPA